MLRHLLKKLQEGLAAEPARDTPPRKVPDIPYEHAYKNNPPGATIMRQGPVPGNRIGGLPNVLWREGPGAGQGQGRGPVAPDIPYIPRLEGRYAQPINPDGSGGGYGPAPAGQPRPTRGPLNRPALDPYEDLYQLLDRYMYRGQ